MTVKEKQFHTTIIIAILVIFLSKCQQNLKERVNGHKLKLIMKPGENNEVENEKSAGAITDLSTLTQDQHF